jgi:hypothetical protein
MISSLHLVFFLIALALLFDIFNGFHDAANSIATVVTTRVLSPVQAVVWASFFNFVAAFVLGTGVAKTVSDKLIDPHVVDMCHRPLRLWGRQFVAILCPDTRKSQRHPCRYLHAGHNRQIRRHHPNPEPDLDSELTSSPSRRGALGLPTSCPQLSSRCSCGELPAGRLAGTGNPCQALPPVSRAHRSAPPP